MATQIVSAVTGSSTATATTSTCTKVRVSTNVGAVYYAVGLTPVANATTCEIIPAGSVRYINMKGLGNSIAFLAVSAATTVSVADCGVVNQSTLVLPNALYVGM